MCILSIYMIFFVYLVSVLTAWLSFNVLLDI